MKIPINPKRSTCPIACTLDLVGDRWTLLVVRDLVLGRTRYDEFLKSPEGIASNILADRLKRLEAQGLVSKEADPQDRRRYCYSLTSSGEELRSLVAFIARWGLDRIPGTQVAPEAEGKV